MGVDEAGGNHSVVVLLLTQYQTKFRLINIWLVELGPEWRPGLIPWGRTSYQHVSVKNAQSATSKSFNGVPEEDHDRSTITQLDFLHAHFRFQRRNISVDEINAHLGRIWEEHRQNSLCGVCATYLMKARSQGCAYPVVLLCPGS